MNTKYQTIVINVTAMLIVTLFLAQVDVDAQKMPGTWHAVPLKRVN